MNGPYAFLNRLSGTAECSVRGAVPAAFLNRCSAAGISVLSVTEEEPGSIRAVLRLRDVRYAEQLALRSQCELKLLRQRGGRFLEKRILRRAVPIFCLLTVFCLLAWSKLYVWEIGVEGNETVSTAKILNALSECGIREGSFWPGYTCEGLRCALLLKMPELSWATVNIHGSRAQVIVRERIERPPLFDAKQPTDLTATQPGFVTQLRVLNGTAAVKPGCAVLPGDVLISGQADSGFSGRRELHAVGSVTAETYYEISAAVPAEAYVRAERGQSRSRWALEIGGKRINFYRNSSICGSNCDKIKKVWQCKIGGLFSLPLALVRETGTPYLLRAQPRDASRARQEMEQQLHALLTAAVEGRGGIESENCAACSRSDTLTVCLRAVCSEEISTERPRIQEDLEP